MSARDKDAAAQQVGKNLNRAVKGVATNLNRAVRQAAKKKS